MSIHVTTRTNIHVQNVKSIHRSFIETNTFSLSQTHTYAHQSMQTERIHSLNNHFLLLQGLSSFPNYSALKEKLYTSEVGELEEPFHLSRLLLEAAEACQVGD